VSGTFKRCRGNNIGEENQRTFKENNWEEKAEGGYLNLLKWGGGVVSVIDLALGVKMDRHYRREKG